jgi:hypothetical protein
MPLRDVLHAGFAAIGRDSNRAFGHVGLGFNPTHSLGFSQNNPYSLAFPLFPPILKQLLQTRRPLLSYDHIDFQAIKFELLNILQKKRPRRGQERSLGWSPYDTMFRTAPSQFPNCLCFSCLFHVNSELELEHIDGVHSH